MAPAIKKICKLIEEESSVQRHARKPRYALCYQELLHAASGHNASVEGERKRPCSGLVKIMAKQRRAKTRAPVVDTACVSDWIGGFCPADSLMIWPCALGSAGDSGIREKRAGPSSEISTMVWWSDPEQVPETIPRCAWQSHSSLPKTPISQEPYSAPYCFNPCWLVFLAGSKLCGSNAEPTTRPDQGGLSDQSILAVGW